MKLLVAIHDVTPALAPECVFLWDACAAHGVTPALFVVPNWHGLWPLELSPRFSAWLRARAAAGAEVFVHGDRHDEEGTRRGPGDTLRALGRTAREGEFLTLAYPEAVSRLRRGVARLRRVGLDPLGFVAPAWLAREDGYRAASALGLRMSEDVTGVRLHDRGMLLRAPVIRWSARTALRAHVSEVVARMRWHTARDCALVRLALHPGDLRHPAATRSLLSEIARWTARRHTWRYNEL